MNQGTECQAVIPATGEICDRNVLKQRKINTIEKQIGSTIIMRHQVILLDNIDLVWLFIYS